MIARTGNLICMFRYWQLVHVKSESALQIVLVINFESRYLKGHVLERASLVSIGILVSYSVMKVALLKHPIIDIVHINSRLVTFVMFFPWQTLVGYG